MRVSHFSAPTIAEVGAIAALADPVVRNLQITQCYHELAVAMSALTGPGANWCAVATWASRQAGQSIRKEDLARTLEDLISSSEDAALRCSRTRQPGCVWLFCVCWVALGPYFVRAIVRARDRLAEELQRLGHLVITEQLMTLRLPGGRVLRLGQDLRADFPQPLTQTTNPDLQALLSKVDLTPDSLDATGAQDWGRLPDRMHFIADLFRAYHLDGTLFDPPFTADQVAAIKTGHLPAGRL